MMDKFVGLISGTSMDAIDAVLVSFEEASAPRLLAHHSLALDDTLRSDLSSLQQPGHDELTRTARLDIQMARLFAQATMELLQQAGCQASEIIAIGSHGQTIRHMPNGDFPTSFQIGDPNLIAELTGITTVADFRRRDMAAGGQGAPLVPAFHQQVFYCEGINRVIVNIGGIANITTLPATQDDTVIGFDTGPGNGLMDVWIHKYLGKNFDQNGEWATQGKIIPDLLASLLGDPYFTLPTPKSTGKEYFHLDWLEKHIDKKMAAEDVQATLCELTAMSITNEIKQVIPSVDEVYVCGGGAHNQTLMQRLSDLLEPAKVASTDKLGLSPDWVEAVCFAWLAKQALHRQTSNLSTVTGARHDVVLGGLYWGN